VVKLRFRAQKGMSAIIVVLLLFMVMSISAVFVWWYFNDILSAGIGTAQTASLSSMGVTQREIYACNLILQYLGNASKCDVSIRPQVATEIWDKYGINLYELLGIYGYINFSSNGTGGVTYVNITGAVLAIDSVVCLDPGCSATPVG